MFSARGEKAGEPRRLADDGDVLAPKRGARRAVERRHDRVREVDLALVGNVDAREEGEERRLALSPTGADDNLTLPGSNDALTSSRAS